MFQSNTPCQERKRDVSYKLERELILNGCPKSAERIRLSRGITKAENVSKKLDFSKEESDSENDSKVFNKVIQDATNSTNQDAIK